MRSFGPPSSLLYTIKYILLVALTAAATCIAAPQQKAETCSCLAALCGDHDNCANHDAQITSTQSRHSHHHQSLQFAHAKKCNRVNGKSFADCGKHAKTSSNFNAARQSGLFLQTYLPDSRAAILAQSGQAQLFQKS